MSIAWWHRFSAPTGSQPGKGGGHGSRRGLGGGRAHDEHADQGQPQAAGIRPDQNLTDADGDEPRVDGAARRGGRLRGADPVAVAPPQDRAQDPPAVKRAPGSGLKAASRTFIAASQPAERGDGDGRAAPAADRRG